MRKPVSIKSKIETAWYHIAYRNHVCGSCKTLHVAVSKTSYFETYFIPCDLLWRVGTWNFVECPVILPVNSYTLTHNLNKSADSITNQLINYQLKLWRKCILIALKSTEQINKKISQRLKSLTAKKIFFIRKFNVSQI